MREKLGSAIISFSFLLALLLFSFSLFSSFTLAEDVTTHMFDVPFSNNDNLNDLADHEVILNLYDGQVSSQFITQQQLSSVGVCSCESYSNTVYVSNTGTLYDTYTARSSGEHAAWTTLAPATFELAPGEKKARRLRI